MIRVIKAVYVSDIFRRLEKGQTESLKPAVEKMLIDRGYAVASDGQPAEADAGGGDDPVLTLEATNEELTAGLKPLSDADLQKFWDQYSDDELKALLVGRFGEEAKDGWNKGIMENMLEKRLGVRD